MKEQNVGWSPSFKRWIFLDFGFAKFLRENIGYKSYGRFIGTYKYTLKQLQELFHLERPGKIDFYYNDMSGLNMVIGILKASSP